VPFDLGYIVAELIVSELEFVVRLVQCFVKVAERGLDHLRRIHCLVEGFMDLLSNPAEDLRDCSEPNQRERRLERRADAWNGRQEALCGPDTLRPFQDSDAATECLYFRYAMFGACGHRFKSGCRSPAGTD
jgi:hypothetical protein